MFYFDFHVHLIKKCLYYESIINQNYFDDTLNILSI